MVVRGAVSPQSLLPAVRAQVATVDPEVPLYDVRTMEEAVSQSLSTRRLTNALLTAFAALAVWCSLVVHRRTAGRNCALTSLSRLRDPGDRLRP